MSVLAPPLAQHHHDRAFAGLKPLVHDKKLAWRRRILSLLGWSICGATFFALGIAMCWIIGMILFSGVSALSWQIFTEPTHGNGGGLLNAIEVLSFWVVSDPARSPETRTNESGYPRSVRS
jgi:hypothetical protein